MQGRRGSVLSMWAPGKDKDGNDVLMHNDDRHDAARPDTVEGGRSIGSPSLAPISPKHSSRRSSSNHGQERRGSVLSMWKGTKDKHGNDIMGGDDEEWAR